LRRVSWPAALCIITLAAFVLRVFHLDVQSLWYDEAFSAYLAHFDLATITARTAADIQPPLYYYLLNFWITLTGDSEFALRFFSLGFGVLTIPLLYAMARRLFDETIALVAALLATMSPLYVWYSQEARMYTLITFLLLLSSYALLRTLEGIRRDPTRLDLRQPWWAVYVAANIAAVYTHYFAFVVIAFQLLFIVLRLLFGSPRASLARVVLPLLALVGVVLVSFAPWAPFVVARFGQDASYWRGALKLDEALRHILINFALGESVLENIGQYLALGWLLILLVGIGAWLVQAAQKKQGFGSFAFVILYLVVPLALLLFLFYRNPKFNARYLMIASPAFLLLLAAGLVGLARLTFRAPTLPSHALRLAYYVSRFAFLILPFAFLLFTLIYSDANAFFDPAFTKASFREVAQYIESHGAANEAIILTSGHMFPAFNYYYHGAAPTIRLPDDPTLNADHVVGFDAANVLNKTLGASRGVWVVLWQDEVVDPNGFVPMLLSSH
jgi:mannosyltransferase